MTHKFQELQKFFPFIFCSVLFGCCVVLCLLLLPHYICKIISNCRMFLYKSPTTKCTLICIDYEWLVQVKSVAKCDMFRFLIHVNSVLFFHLINKLLYSLQPLYLSIIYNAFYGFHLCETLKTY